MTRLPLSVNPQAEKEALEAAKWYEARSRGLGAAILEIIEQSLDGIQENPFRFPIAFRDIRKALLKRFPYGIYFRVRPDRIRILAIMHLSRNPERWRRRV